MSTLEMAPPPLCQRLVGGSIFDCHCMLADGGWLECPEPLRRPLPKLDEVLRTLPIPVGPISNGAWPPITATEFAEIAEAVLTPSSTEVQRGTVSDPPPAPRLAYVRPSDQGEKMNTVLRARGSGFTGELCDSCGGANMIRSGTCSTCLDCGSTSGCS